MSSIQKFLRTFLGTLISLSCNQSNHENHKDSTNGPLILNIELSPAFYEHAETVLFKSDSHQFIQILLRNDVRADRSEDTFWFKKIYVNDSQFENLNSQLIAICRQKVINNLSGQSGVDGIGISSRLITKGDTNSIFFWSPTYAEDSIGY